jgi:hypothetical protein
MAEQLGTRADAGADELAEGQRRLEVMLDRLVVLYLAHTWQVPPEFHASASASANRRYGNYCRTVDNLLAGKDADGKARQPAHDDSEAPGTGASTALTSGRHDAREPYAE